MSSPGIPVTLFAGVGIEVADFVFVVGFAVVEEAARCAEILGDLGDDRLETSSVLWEFP